MVKNPVTLEDLNHALLNNEHYFKVIKGEKSRIMIEKWPHINTWDIKVLDLHRDYIQAIYDHLYIADTFNMIKELCVEL